MLAIVITPEGPQALSAWPSRLTSLALHTGLFMLAALGTQAPPPVPDALRDTTIFFPTDPAPPRPGPPSPPSPPGRPGFSLPAVLQLPVTIPLPDVVAPGLAPAPWADPWPGIPGVPGDTNRAAPGLSGSPFDARVVEEPPALLSHPAPRYPEVLRQAGIEGDVMVEAVLDTLGHVEPGSLRVVRGAHALLDAEAVTVVSGSLYRPGRMGAHAVRVRIQVPVRFALRR